MRDSHFEIPSQGERLSGFALHGEPVPELFIKGSGLYSANLNAENLLGTMQSIEHGLRALDRTADEEQERSTRFEKNCLPKRNLICHLSNRQ